VNVTVNNVVSSNIAGLATVTASSQNTNTGQLAIKAVDGVVDGYPGDYTKEWATRGGKVGSWLKLAWGSAYTINQVVLYDRPNTSDRITGATLSFSDGSSVTVGTLANNGTAVTVSFPAHTVTSLTLTVTGVSSTTTNVGLAEIVVYGVPVTGLANTTGVQLNYSFVAPTGTTDLSIQASGAAITPITMFGSAPTTSTYESDPHAHDGNKETCAVPRAMSNATTSTRCAMAQGYGNFANVSLVGNLYRQSTNKLTT
jgi:hypothetical protein